MADTPAPQPELHELAKIYLLTKSAFNRAYVRFWNEHVKACTDDVGWKLLDVLRRNVEQYYFKYGRRDRGIEDAAWELFRLELVGEADYGQEDSRGFVKWYRAIKGRIDQSISHMFDFQGDSFGDLVDSYPLAGRELVERALASNPKSDRPRREGFLDEGELRGGVLEKLGPPWHKLICEGENYVAAALEKACYKCYLIRIRTGPCEQVVWTEEEQEAVSFSSHFDD